MKTLMLASCDLGLHVNGARLGPKAIAEYFKDYRQVELDQKDIVKSTDKNDKRKNLDELVSYSRELYELFNKEYEKGNEPVLVGGDHSLAVPSILSSVNKHGDIGLIWIDAHTDYHTLETTISGNLHGCPCACATGYYNEELRAYHQGKTINPKRTVIFGARSIDGPEFGNYEEAGVTVITSNDLREQGVKACLDKALEVLGDKFHVSYDLDFYDPSFMPGVSVPECDGPLLKEYEELMPLLVSLKDRIVSFDLVEYNPLLDYEDVTLNRAVSILKSLL